MKTKFFTLLLLLVFAPISKADQLAYLSKADAEKGAALIEQYKKVILFCGCCDNSAIEKIKIQSVEVKHTGYENYYEITVSYVDHGELKSVPLDLAYVWVKTKKEGVQTIGALLGLEHDPCKTPY